MTETGSDKALTLDVGVAAEQPKSNRPSMSASAAQSLDQVELALGSKASFMLMTLVLKILYKNTSSIRQKSCCIAESVQEDDKAHATEGALSAAKAPELKPVANPSLQQFQLDVALAV